MIKLFNRYIIINNNDYILKSYDDNSCLLDKNKYIILNKDKIIDIIYKRYQNIIFSLKYNYDENTFKIYNIKNIPIYNYNTVNSYFLNNMKILLSIKENSCFDIFNQNQYKWQLNIID